jgi:hypothetical protein
MAKKRIDPAARRAQKQKIFVAVGGVVLLAVFAVEAKTLGFVGGKDAAPATAPAATTPASTVPGTPATPAGTLVDTDRPVASAEGQLAAFSTFRSKNPFAPQVSESTPTATTPAPAAAAPTTTTPAAPGAAPPAVAPAPATAPQPVTARAITSAVASATISVNGNAESVGTNGTFPNGAPVFRLVSVAAGAAQVGIVGGSYQTGAATLTLNRGKPVTLVNTSDGKRYRLELVRTS